MADKTQGPVVYTALIMPLSSHASFPKPLPPGGGQPPTGGQPPHPDHTLPGDLPKPEHPIWWPLPPGVPVDPDYGLPVKPGEEGGAPRPDQGLPGNQPRPDHGLPPFPEHPIVLPPGGGDWEPVYIWGPTDPRPTPPIALPPDGELPDDNGGAKIKFKAVWTPATGWVSVGIVIPGEGANVPTPSRQKK